ncbi:AzlC family ABC transporter permease [Limimaricola hongkongensis]|uniref:AzlC family protein n=1 Tax=Limimaricola hongkongensis DSM 17492 TaxID=1122180 RepID=A0A017H9L1_9RHOB|nr:AzlC family ABC transporter permease [Limimaricola hongkongensis]EYD70469.1 AzlC family protein [Limimaricola hongkongensis DSM 17492]
MSSPFRAGFRDCLPFVLIVVPFSTLFGVVARDAGLDILQVMAMSVIVVAGASQFTALSLLQDGAPVFVALLAALAVNLRMAMYSAALVPHLGGAPLGMRALAAYFMVDQSFAVAVRHYEDSPQMTGAEKLRYYFGCITAICPLWYACSFAGALMGRAIPASLSLDFAVPVCFIALLAPLLRSAPHLVAALVSGLATVALAGLPWNLGLPLAALAAMIAGAQSELHLARRAARRAACPA